ncbi:hypothetical protein [Mangrovimonas sp. YM274]|uniref:hypothetical protein n=1 Tax=Mangrovimonas sp. YM274 TaxID=3070660 RepID=UPI0027DBF4F5|nr:hypothetical protein [Mangrovimonas sp. YM274]WMI69020.1 hypothetical protein RBH95_01305 [Mangrovimonas sp. YM274]
MKRPLLLPTLLITQFIFSQNIVIADTINKSPIPFATIKYNKTDGDYSNPKGIIDLTQVSFDTLEISHLGYNTVKIPKLQVIDTIYMTPHATQLESVTVKAKTDEQITFKPLKKSSLWKSCILTPKLELCALVYPKTEYWDYYLDMVSFSFYNDIGKNDIKKLHEEIDALIRINIYHNNKGKLGEQIYSSTPIKINNIEKDEIQHDISSLMLKATPDGYWFTLEMLGYYSNNNEVTIDGIPFVRPRLTQKESKFCQVETYHKYVFNENDNFVHIDKVLKMGGFYGENEHRYLSIGFTISK